MFYLFKIVFTNTRSNRSGAHLICIVLCGLLFTACGGGSDNDGNEDPPLVTQQTGWIREVQNPMLLPRITSTSIDLSIADPSILYDSDDGLWKIWFSSSVTDISTGIEILSIKYSESTDGVNWPDGQIAFQVSSDNNAWDYTHTETPVVIKNPNPGAPANQQFMLWYAGANRNLAAAENRPDTFPYYQIGLAYSADGRSFSRHTPGLNNLPGLVVSANGAMFDNGLLGGIYGDGLVADPEVVYQDGIFHMWFSSYAESVPTPIAATGRAPLGFGVSHMTSLDGVSWTASHDNPLVSLRRPGGLSSGQQPSVYYDANSLQYEMWLSNDTDAEKLTLPCSFFTVRGFWRATSVDGITWTPEYSALDFSHDVQYGYEEFGLLTGVDVIEVNNTKHLYYSAWGSDQIPDPIVNQCPDQGGTLFPAVLSLNKAVYVSP